MGPPNTNLSCDVKEDLNLVTPAQVQRPNHQLTLPLLTSTFKQSVLCNTLFIYLLFIYYLFIYLLYTYLCVCLFI